MPDSFAIYNLERTVVDFVFSSALADIEALDGNANFAHSRGWRESVADSRAALIGWMAGRNLLEVEPLLDRTSEVARRRLAPWAATVMHDQIQAGHKLGLYSATVPHDLVEAYADGIEAAAPSLTIEFVKGRPLEQSGGRYTGEVGCMPKAETLEKLEKEGAVIEFVADSFFNAMPAVRKARKPLLVNPESGLANDERSSDIDRLYWDIDHHFRAKLQKSNQPRQRTFYFGTRDAREIFVNHLYS